MRKEIGAIASPDKIQFAPGLPKTRSGKIMRRILRKIAEDDFGALGDTSTLADPAVVDDLIANRQNKKCLSEPASSSAELALSERIQIGAASAAARSGRASALSPPSGKSAPSRRSKPIEQPVR